MFAVTVIDSQDDPVDRNRRRRNLLDTNLLNFDDPSGRK